MLIVFEQAVQTAINTESTGAVQYSFPVEPGSPNGAKLTRISGQSLYRFSQYGLYEFPFSWFAKCTVLVGRYPSDELVNCQEWTDRFEVGKFCPL